MGGLLEGHRAAVTGGGSGIGRAIAAGYAEQGAEILILDANEDSADAVRREIVEAGHAASSITLDVTDRAMCADVARRVSETIGDISILVNNAGINRRTPRT